MAEFTDEVLEETARWRTREIKYWSGAWERLSTLIPEFKTVEWRFTPDTPANPYQKVVLRLPLTRAEQEIPVGVVSNSYGLAQHKMVVERCLDGLRFAGIDPKELRCELGMTELGEWMNFRLYFPDSYDHTPADGQKLGLRLECFNSVDGSSRLVILLGWLRFVCSNGLVIGETKAELRNIHNSTLDLGEIPSLIAEAIGKVKIDLERLSKWDQEELKIEQIKPWVNRVLADKWNKKAACRVFHICNSGCDVELADVFAKGEATEKPVTKTQRVPGAPERAKNLYDVSQALSWVATKRNNPEERLQWQEEIPHLISRLAN